MTHAPATTAAVASRPTGRVDSLTGRAAAHLPDALRGVPGTESPAPFYDYDVIAPPIYGLK